MYTSWNYFYYATYKLLSFLGEALIEKPLVYFFNSIPALKRNWNKGKKEYHMYMNSKEYGLNIGSAYRCMFFAALIIYASVCLLLVKVLGLEVGDAVYRYFIGVIFCSYVTNYYLLHRNDIYITYFKEFDQAEHGPNVYYSALVFHISVIAFGFLSVYFTIGFDL